MKNIINNINKYYNKLIGIKHKFNNPSDIAVGSDGIFYITDTYNHVICKISEDGDIEVYAGKIGVSGYNNGSRLDATFNKPRGITIDSNNNLFIADSSNNIIRRIDVNGIVTTLAGTAGVKGQNDGNGINSFFNNPIGITISKDNVIYIADTGNCLIRKITTNLDVITIAGKYMIGKSDFADGLGPNARFSYPYGITIDDNNNLYIADTLNHSVRMITPDSNVSTVAGTNIIGNTNGPSKEARFNDPTGIKVYKNNIYITDKHNNSVKLINSDGQVSSINIPDLLHPNGLIIYNNNIIIIDGKKGIIKQPLNFN